MDISCIHSPGTFIIPTFQISALLGCVVTGGKNWQSEFGTPNGTEVEVRGRSPLSTQWQQDSDYQHRKWWWTCCFCRITVMIPQSSHPQVLGQRDQGWWCWWILAGKARKSCGSGGGRRKCGGYSNVHYTLHNHRTHIVPQTGFNQYGNNGGAPSDSNPGTDGGGGGL